MAVAKLLLPLVTTLTACLSEPPLAPPDAGASALGDAGEAPFRVHWWAVRDFSGRVHPPDDAPRRPVLHVETTAPLAAESDALALLSGPPSDPLLEDLGRSPLRAANEARRVPVSLEHRGTALLVTPDAALPAGSAYTLALGAWAADDDGRDLDEPFVAEVRVATGPHAGASVAESWPADGTAGVPPALSMVAVRFDGDVDGFEGVRLVTSGGDEVGARRQAVLCELVGWPPGRCVLLRPDRDLASGSTYHILVEDTVRDATGAPVGPWEATFATGAAWDDRAPSWLRPSCALDEDEVTPGCALLDDRSLTLRVQADAPLRLWLSVATSATSAVAPRGEASLRVEGLAPGRVHDVTLRGVDLAGRERVERFSMHSPSDLATVSITEVRADARGDEPAQEYVEVANFGETAVDLRGLALSDRADREGDVVPHSFLLPPGARALLVADGFDPSDAADDPVPPGIALVRLGRSLASGGLTNGGEPLFLRDPEGRRLSAAPALPSPGAGACVVRTATDPRTGDPAAFGPDAAGGCTPGRRDRLP